MKLRTGFVSNSSSSSFVIKLDDITASQLNKIKNARRFAKKLGVKYSECADEWDITVDDYTVRGYTIMDNFVFSEFLEKIGVDMDDVDYCRD